MRAPTVSSSAPPASADASSAARLLRRRREARRTRAAPAVPRSRSPPARAPCPRWRQAPASNRSATKASWLRSLLRRVRHDAQADIRETIQTADTPCRPCPHRAPAGPGTGGRSRPPASSAAGPERADATEVPAVTGCGHRSDAAAAMHRSTTRSPPSAVPRAPYTSRPPSARRGRAQLPADLHHDRAHVSECKVRQPCAVPGEEASAEAGDRHRDERHDRRVRGEVSGTGCARSQADTKNSRAISAIHANVATREVMAAGRRKRSERELDDGACQADGAELAQGYEAARHGPVGSVLGVVFRVLVLVENAELEEEQERDGKRRDESECTRRTGATVERNSDRSVANVKAATDDAVCGKGNRSRQ